MIYTVNKREHPYDGLNIHLRALEKTGLTKHKMGFSPQDEELRNADFLILGNFLPAEVFQIRSTFPAKIKIGYLYCSPFGQASCNGELQTLYDLNEMVKLKNIDYLFCADKDVFKALNHSRVLYLPSVSDFEGVTVPNHERTSILLIGNNLRTSRNFANQLAGIKFAQDLGMSDPIYSQGMNAGAYEFFRRLMGIINWENNPNFITEEHKVQMISGCKLGLQITYSDAFNIAAYEHAMCEVPCLISASLRWGVEDFRVKRIDSPQDIGRKIYDILEHYPQDFSEWKNAAKAVMEENFEECYRTLRNVYESYY